MLNDKYTAAFIFYVLGGLWLLGWWLVEHPSPRRPKIKKGWTQKQKRQFYKRWMGTLIPVGITAVMCTWTMHLSLEKDKELLYGRLYPANDTAPGPCVPGEGELVFYIGNSSAQVPADAMPFSLIRVGGEHVLDIDRDKDGSFILIADIKDNDGKVIVRFDKDGFLVNKNNYLSMKRPDRSTLIVVDQQGAEALNARFLNKRNFRVRGKFYASGRLIDLSRGAAMGNFELQNICVRFPPEIKGHDFAVLAMP